MIPQNIPTITGLEQDLLQQFFDDPSLFGGRHFFTKCEEWFGEIYPGSRMFVTTSGSRALELAALLLDIQPGDEVILPSYTYVATANAFVLRGAVPVFVDIRKDTLNIDETLIESAITDKTKAIVAVHYAGIPCELDVISDIAKKHNLVLIEDNAQGLLSSYKGKPLGSFGAISCVSFNFTKHIQVGEGGMIVINDPQYNNKAELIYEAGTNRQEFMRGESPVYEWKFMGSKFYPSPMDGAFLFAQLTRAKQVVQKRQKDFNRYQRALKPLQDMGLLDLPFVPEHCEHNAHLYHIRLKDKTQRSEIIGFLKNEAIRTAFHYIPLHQSEYGQQIGRFHGEDVYTTKESERLLRLPLYYTIEDWQIDEVTDKIFNFFS